MNPIMTASGFRSFLKILSTVVLQSLSQLFALLFLILIARNFPVAVFGRFSLGLNIGQAISTICAMGSSFIIAKKFGENSGLFFASKKLYPISNYFLIQGLIVVFIALGIVSASYQDPIITIAYGIAVSSFSIQVIAAFFVATNCPVFSNAIQALRQLFIFAVATLVFKNYSINFESFSILLLISLWLFSILLCLIMMIVFSFNISAPPLNDIFSFGGQSMISLILKQSDLLLLSLIATKVELGYYSAALAFSSLAAIGLFAINSNFTSQIASSLSSNSLVVTQSLLKKASKFSLAFSAPSSLLLFFLASRYSEIFGSSFEAAFPIFSVLFIGQIIVIISGSSYLVANLMLKEKCVTRFLFDSFALKVFIGVPCAIHFGVLGFAFISSIANCLWHVRTFNIVKRSSGLDSSLFNLVSWI